MKREASKTGDRVVVDGYSSTGTYVNGLRGVVIGFTSAATQRVKLDGPVQDIVEVSWRQCRRLVKKPRRRVWISIKKSDGSIGSAYKDPIPPEEMYPGWEEIEFIEVRRKAGK